MSAPPDEEFRWLARRAIPWSFAEFAKISLFKGRAGGYVERGGCGWCVSQSRHPAVEQRIARNALPRSLPVSFRLLLAVGLVIGLPTLLQAQVNNRSQLQRQQQQAAMQQPVDMQGRIQNAAKGIVMVTTNNNQLWRVGLVPLTKIHVTGKATADSLRTGLIVEFVAEIDDSGAIQGKVDALTITSLTREKQLGLFPPGDAKADDVVDGFGPNAKKDQDSGDTGVKHGKRPARATGKATPRTQPAGKYRIVGQLTVARGGALSVQTRRGAPLLTFELADQAKIDIDMADFTLVGRGNEVSVKGYVVPGRSGMMQAAEIRVRLPEPQAGENPEPAVRPEAKKSAKRPKKDKDESLPEPSGDQ